VVTVLETQTTCNLDSNQYT